jgi:hypothetical protein
MPERHPREIEKGLDQVDNQNEALEAAGVEAPIRNLARNKKLEITTAEKDILDKVADRAGQAAIDEYRRHRQDQLTERIKRLHGEFHLSIEGKGRSRFRINEAEEPTANEWDLLLEHAKRKKIYPLLEALHRRANHPIASTRFPDIFQRTSYGLSQGDIDQINTFFISKHLLYRIKAASNREVKLFVVEEA